MKKRTLSSPYALGFGICCALLLNSCSKDGDYNFDDIDSLFGIGGEELVLPTNNSTKRITLDDFLELNNSNFVHIAANGDYTLSIDDDESHSASGHVDAICISNPADRIYDGEIPAIPGRNSGTLASFEYSDRSVSEDIVGLEWADIDAEICLQIHIPNSITRMQSFKLLMPEYLTISRATLDGNALQTLADNTITLTNLTTGDHRLRINISRLTFGSETTTRGHALFNSAQHKVSITGNIEAEITLNQEDFTASGLAQIQAGSPSNITGSCTVTDITARSAYGKFSTQLDFNQLGSVALNVVPDFLTDSQVCLELYDPHIDIRFNSELPMGGKVDGTLKALDAAGNVMASVRVEPFTLTAGSSIVSIRRQNIQAGGDTTTVVVPALTDLVKTIPARIEFSDIHAQTDGSQSAEILMDHSYQATAQYGLLCPLQFGNEAVIVYTDSVTDWNDDIKDLAFREIDGAVDGYLLVEADIENTVPAYFTITASGIDTDGNEISQNDLLVTVDQTIAASPDGVSPTSTTVSIKMQPLTNRVFSRLDGLRFRLTGTAADVTGENAVTGKTLNAHNQYIKATHITVTKHGKVVYDAN